MNANEQLREYTGSDNYYKHSFGMVCTDGVKALCDQFECYWFLDIIVSYQRALKDQDFQVWTFGRHEDGSAVVIATNGNNRILQTQKIDYTDFKPTEATVWVEGNVILLPSEH